MRITGAGRTVFAAIIIVVGVLGLVRADFAPVWEPVPQWVPLREALVYFSALLSLACGAGLLSQRSAAPAAAALLAALLFWVLLFRLPMLVRTPMGIDSWEGCAESIVILAGAWALYAGLETNPRSRCAVFASGDRGIRMARLLYGSALIPFGLAHFAYLKETAALVPGWLPLHQVWAYFTGVAYIAAGVGRGLDHRRLRKTSRCVVGAADGTVHIAGLGAHHHVGGPEIGVPME